MLYIRPPAFAGQFYPKNPEALFKKIKNFLDQAKIDQKLIKKNNQLKGLIVPHAGYNFSGLIAAYGYKLLNQLNKKQNYQIILIGPNHNYTIQETVADNHQSWQTPLGLVKTIDQKTFKINNQAHLLEHSLEVQLPFLQTVLSNFKIIPLTLAYNQPKQLALKLEKLYQKLSDPLFIISSDLSHYLPYALAKENDQKTCSAISNLNTQTLLDKPESACGLIGILAIMEIARQKNWQIKLLKYLNSGDTSKEKNQVVGYASFAIIAKI